MPRRKELPKFATALLCGAGVASLVGLLRLSGALDLWELKTRDYRTRWTLAERKEHDPPVRPDVMLINVTDDSLKRVDELFRNGMKWPWDRETQGYVVKACARGKAASLLYDFLINEVGEPDDEKCLVDAVMAGPPAYFAGAFREKRLDKDTDTPEHRALLEKLAIEVDNDGSVKTAERYEAVILPTPRLCGVVAGVCDISTPRDEDGLIRRYRLFSTYHQRYYPSFVLAAIMAREKARIVRVRSRQLLVGSTTLPVEEDGSILLRYYPPRESFLVRSAFNVIQDAVRQVRKEPSTYDYSQFEGKTVFFATSAVGLTDLRLTPVSRQPLPGVEIHMSALANILNGEFLREAPGWASALLFALMAFAVALATRYSPAAVGGVASAGALAGVVALSVALYQGRWVVDVVPSVVAIVFSYAASSAVNFLYEGRQRLRIKRDFQRYMSPKVVEKILKNPDALSVKGEKKMLTIFFMDFKGFTAMSERLDAEELVSLISEYHNEAAEEIFGTEGTLDKYIGDAIMAFWNDPIAQEDHALRACLSAIGAQKRLVDMARKMKERGLPEMSARIGINTGIATVGNMGARNQVNYTVIGDEVNLASRLEGVNKEFGTAIIVSEASCQTAKDRLEVRELALIKVKGRKQPVRIFELMGLKGEVPAERIARARKFEQALEELRGRRFQKAWEIFLALTQEKDPAAEPYLALCERYLNEGPSADWDGSYQMESK
jgi:adenylate cyclase